MSTPRTGSPLTKKRIPKRSRLHVVYYDVAADVRCEWKTKPDVAMTRKQLVEHLRRILAVLTPRRVGTGVDE
jgi:hypothetical protein